MKQFAFFPPISKEHGGALSVGKRRGPRPISTSDPIHFTLRSEYAKGPRSLMKYKEMIRAKVRRAAKKFGIRIYEFAICSNHLHALIRAHSREGLQNFFRVFAGHTAQTIVKDHPLSRDEIESRKHQGCLKNRRKFWELLLYSRVLTWGKEFRTVSSYIEQNELESLFVVAYRPRDRKKRRRT